MNIGMLQNSEMIYVIVAIAMALAVLVVGLIFVGYRIKKQRDHIRSKILPLHQEVTAQNAVYLVQKEHANKQGKKFGLSIDWLNQRIIQSGKKISAGRFLLLIAVLMLIFLAGMIFLGLPVFYSVLIAITLGCGGPFMALRIFKARRLKKFGAQFTEAIELIVRSLRAGHPVPTAIQMVSREMPDPIRTEFATIANEVSYGSDLVTAIQGLQERLDSDDLPLFVTAISIQSQTGGNLSIILAGLADVLRQRVKLKRKVKAAAAEGRASALILNSVPIAVLLFISIVTPDYYGAIITETFIIVGLACAFGWMMVGNVVMYKMMHFKV